jgi:uncharacterized protein YdbL (DUF1318 family)
MKTAVVLMLAVIISLGCAKLQVQAPKEAIKVDISMRLDIYQHIAKDIDEIENIVAGKDKGGFMFGFVGSAFAEEGLSPEVERAALSRKDRRPELFSWEEKGVVGENKSGLAEIRNSAAADSSVRQLVNAENSNRMVIYRGVAAKNNSSVEEVQRLYAKRLQEHAPSGTPIEVLNASGNYEWQTK